MTIRLLPEIELPSSRFFSANDDAPHLAVGLATSTVASGFASMQRVRIKVTEISSVQDSAVLTYLVELLEQRPLLTKAEVAMHYRVTVRNLERWLADEKKHFPKPV